MPPKCIITNNPYVRNLWQNGQLTGYELLWIPGNILTVLTAVRNNCHSGARLLTHPLSGSIKPNQTPVKTVIVEQSSAMDPETVIMAESCWHKARSLLAEKPLPLVDEQVYQDLCLVDFSLIAGFLAESRNM